MNDFEQCSNQLQLALISLLIKFSVSRIIIGQTIRPTGLLLCLILLFWLVIYFLNEIQNTNWSTLCRYIISYTR